MSPVEVSPVPGENLREPLRLLEEWLRDSEPVPEPFLHELQRHVEAGDLEVLSACIGGGMVGVLVLAFRPNLSLGAHFASVEDLYVRPGARRRGVGRALLQAAEDRCSKRRISYLEAQVEEDDASVFYAASGYEPQPEVRILSRSLAIQLSDDAEPRT